MSDKNVDNPHKRGKSLVADTNIAEAPGEVSNVAGSVQSAKTNPRVSSSSDRQLKFERAQKCLENAALVSKKIKEHRKATAELLGRPFEDDNDGGDTASEMATTISERTGYSVATDTSTTLSVQEALNIPGISESLANTLKQKELLMERIKQYKVISKRPMKTAAITKDSSIDIKDTKMSKDNTDVAQLINTIKEKENALTAVQLRMKAMEMTILDLQEKNNEKDQIIEAKNKATTLMSDSLSKKEKDSLALLEDTRQQMVKMQENFVNMETEWKEERLRLIKQIEEKDEKIVSLQEANTILEQSRFEISVANSKLVEELDLKSKEILELQEKIEQLSQQEAGVEKLTDKEKEDAEEEKGSIEIANMAELTKKVELLEQLNCQIRQTNKELENKLANINPDPKTPATSSPSKKGSPLPTRKAGRGTAKKSPWSQLSTESVPQEVDKKPNKTEISKLEMVVQGLNKEILDKEYLISQKDIIISELQSLNMQNETIINELKLQTRPVTVDVADVAICTDDLEKSPVALVEEPKHIKHMAEIPVAHSIENARELYEKLKDAEAQIAALNNEIEAANKNMIKVKSNHKLKLKQMQKTIDNFSKVSDSNAEIVKLNEELHQLSQKVAELEEEKGNLQLHLVDYDSGRLTESDVYKKMVEMEHLAEARLKSISVLETQKFDLVQELHELQQNNADMEDRLADLVHFHSEQVSAEMKSVQLEEQIDQLTASKRQLELIIENLKLDKGHLEGTIERLEEEKEKLLHKLENYIQENMELTDKLEKLSAEKVSSAESIEIVESLTTQEKLELEEYNKGMAEHKVDESHGDTPVSPECQKNVEKLVEQSAELSRKIELFTQERQEVMEKMNRITTENESLHQKIEELSNQCDDLQNNIELLSNEKQELNTLTEDLNRQIEDLRQERLELMKESVEIVKPTGTEETADVGTDAYHDDKAAGEKGNKGAKSVKQLTKEILKLKNTIKEREAEIGDCQMKILSLEEQQQKHSELIQINATYETKIKSLTDENQSLKEELNRAKKENDFEQELQVYKQNQEALQQEMNKLQHDYAISINTREIKVQELEALLLEYEKQLMNYGNIFAEKDKELSEYINQVTKLNDVSHKLRSTIEILEEEKAKDPNVELVKSLNKQIATYQKKLAENEDKLKKLEEEKAQLLSLKVSLESKNVNLEAELKKMHESFTENQNLIKELTAQQSKHSEEVVNIHLQLKERDEEIHEVKLQLRKESIENEKLRTILLEKVNSSEKDKKDLEEVKEKLKQMETESKELIEQKTAMETKNKELMEKLKKFAVTVKKKSAMYIELEAQLVETQKEIESKNSHLEQLLIQVETLPALQEKLKYAEEELNRMQAYKINLEQQKTQDVLNLQRQLNTLQDNLTAASKETAKLNDDITVAHKELYVAREENAQLKSQIEMLNNKLADFEVEQKNNSNLITKISSLEADINQKQLQMAELVNKLEIQEQQLSQIQFGQDAKIQERDLYIESLETEINKYKHRICRLEESISVMEDRRHTLERKADQLGSQLEEKQKAYSEYTNQEDQLVGRLAVLMDHDRVVEKQLHEIENENKELQHKAHFFSEENQRLRKSLADIQDHYNNLTDKANRTDMVESELAKYQTQVHELDSHLKRITHDHQFLLQQKKKEIEEIESEFNTQIENAIREKKALSEKYEKILEHVTKLENKLHEYKTNNETLSINIEELTRMNHELMEKSSHEHTYSAPDYTEQYINEINKLNSMVNNKNQEIHDLNKKFQTLQANYSGKICELENHVSELNIKLQQSNIDIEKMYQESNSIKSKNEELQTYLYEKEQQIKHLVEEKSVSFEMTIPKTEGMLISSTIEPLRDTQKNIDLTYIESQIISEGEPKYEPHAIVKRSEQHQKSSDKVDSFGEVKEPQMVAKKAYVCYKGDENVSVQPDDPFNSDEGWGLGESEEAGEVTPGLTHLNEQIQQLRLKNEELKANLDVSNIKLLKALKKLKELKANNDVLSNELKISKQLSQSSFLDSAIEDEMKINIQELEKKIEELTADLNKERRDKESLRKQNEVFNSANDRLTEMKEKMDSELELWKFKFKQVNDKLGNLEWGTDSTPEHKPVTLKGAAKDDALTEEINKLEKENEELQSIIDQLSDQNKNLLLEQAQLKTALDNLNKQLEQNQSSNEIVDSLNSKLLELQKNNSEILERNNDLEQKLQDMNNSCSKITKECESYKLRNEELQTTLETKNLEFTEKVKDLDNKIQSLKAADADAQNKLSSLLSELETAKSKLFWHEQEKSVLPVLNVDTPALEEKYNSMENYCLQLKNDLDVANAKISTLEIGNKAMVDKLQDYEKHVNELNEKIQHLNTENDQLLSTVAELRSSVSSAVDQRGFEIAELWKQHLAQREADFQKTEQELRVQLSAAEVKYEQLLDNMQSSSQEETNTLVMAEQMMSLQNKLQEKEEHLRNLQDKYAEVINQIDIMRSEVEDEKIMHENKLFTQQEEYEKQIKEIIKKNKRDSENYQEIHENLRKELADIKLHNDELNEQVTALLNTVNVSEAKVVELNNDLRTKDSEIYQKTRDLTITLAQRNDEFENVRKQLLEYEKKIEDLTYEKESELAVLRLKMHEKAEDFEKALLDTEEEKLSLTQELNAKIIECTNLNKQLAELNKKLQIDAENTAEMQTALENQELEIVELKDEVANLQEMLRASSKLEKHVTFASDTKPGAEIPQKSEEAYRKEFLDPVPRAELDLALYMLHQRDVRCEELTMELTRLLEERDTLQLRLSDSLRSIEELRSRCQSAGLDTSMDTSQETVSDLPTFSADREQQLADVHRGQTSRSSSISDPDGDKPKLQAKLSELRSVRHSRDVLLRHESEQRDLDLRLLQRDVANLPPEAVDQLAQAHHTLSRDTQSTSTVLLNWLRGKSTPKVVHNM